MHQETKAKRPITWLQFADELVATPDLLDGLGFVVTELSDYSISLDVYDIEISPVGDDGKFGADRVCHLYVKWDGCSHMSTEDDSMMHLCGARGWADTMELIRCGAFTLAAKHVTNFDAELAGWRVERPVVELRRDDLVSEVDG